MSAPSLMLVLVGFTATFAGTTQTFRPGDKITRTDDLKSSDAIWNTFSPDHYVMDESVASSYVDAAVTSVIEQRLKGNEKDLAIQLLIARIKDLLD